MQQTLNFDGETFVKPRDGGRLTGQWHRVLKLMSDGKWRTLSEIHLATGYPLQSISARLRDFRKSRFGNWLVEREYLDRGVWRYRVLPSDKKGLV